MGMPKSRYPRPRPRARICSVLYGNTIGIYSKSQNLDLARGGCIFMEGWGRILHKTSFMNNSSPYLDRNAPLRAVLLLETPKSAQNHRFHDAYLNPIWHAPGGFQVAFSCGILNKMEMQ